MIVFDIEELAEVIYRSIYGDDADEPGRVVPFRQAPLDVVSNCMATARAVDSWLMRHRTYAAAEEATGAGMAAAPSRADVDAMAPETRGRVEAIKAFIRHVDVAERPGGAMAATLAMLGIDVSDVGESQRGARREL